jgi:hypothetical protein
MGLAGHVVSMSLVRRVLETARRYKYRWEDNMKLNCG